MKAMILAAGRGERMRALTANAPKPLLEIGGAPLIEHHVRHLAACGIGEIVINLSYRGTQIREWLGDGRRWHTSIAYSEEGEPPLETAGGIVHALPFLGAEPFLVVNSDVFTAFDCRVLMRAPARRCIVLVPNPTHHPQGDFGLDESGLVRAEPPLLTYAGIGVFDPLWFSGLEPGRRPLKPLLDAAIVRRELHGVRFEGQWIDVGTPERLEEARALASRS